MTQAMPALAGPPSRRSMPALAVILTLLLPVASAALTTIERGDVLRVEVVSAPELSRDAAPVDTDGRIALPALGTIEVAGRDIDTVSARIAEAFEARGVLVSPVVLVEVATYRQIYVGGRVGRPGAIDFVPGMTARQAIISAGGIALASSEASDKAAQTLAAVAERRATLFALSQVAARIARIEAELDGSGTLPAPAQPAVISPRVQEMTVTSETALLRDLRQTAETREQHATDLLDLIALEIDTLDQQAAFQDAEAEVQLAEINDARSLVERGLLPRPRLQELLREQSQLSRDRLETSAFTARARQAAETVRYELEAEIAQRREALRLELQATQRERTRLEAGIETLDLRILAGGMTPADTVRTRLVIHRGAAAIDAAMDDPVMPGDVLELSLVSSGPTRPADALPTTLSEAPLQ